MSPQSPISFGKSLRVAVRGICDAFQSERNFRTHLLVTAIVIVAGVIAKLELLEWIAIVLCIGIVLATELMNTAVETVVDLVSPDYHELARKAKDISAGAVLTVTGMSVVVGLVILGNAFITRGSLFSRM